MPIFELDEDYVSFPPPELAEPSGLLAHGGILNREWVLEAYRRGIFPWYNLNEPPLWWSPNPRCVIFPDRIKISKSMRQVLRSNQFEVTFDRAFRDVITACKTVHTQEGGTWISADFVEVYAVLHEEGFCHSVEVWRDGELVGGLYGATFGKLFFGESMFSKASNASKTALIMLSKNLAERGFELIDCQVENPHLVSMGATLIPRMNFLSSVRRNRELASPIADWSSDLRTDFRF